MTVHIAFLVGESLGVVDSSSGSQRRSTTVDSRIQNLPSTSTMMPRFESNSTVTPESPDLCLGLGDIFVALFLVRFITIIAIRKYGFQIVLIMTTIFGNILVVLSVCLYKRMRTFTNILLTSLATADLCVGVIVMPLALIDLLYRHNWPFGRMLCRIWATVDVLLCTASILNLCIISLDRYMAITSPLRYSRTRLEDLKRNQINLI